MEIDKIMSKFIKNPSKIRQNDAQERPSGDLGKGLVPGRLEEQTRSSLGDHFWSLLAPLGDFDLHLGATWGPVGAKWRPQGAKREPEINQKSMQKPMQKSVPKK